MRRSNQPKLENVEWQPTLEIASMQSSYVTQNCGVRISISSRVRHLYRGFNTASTSERMGSGLPSAYERLGSRELMYIHTGMLLRHTVWDGRLGSTPSSLATYCVVWETGFHSQPRMTVSCRQQVPIGNTPFQHITPPKHAGRCRFCS